jgi:phage tail sheath protein FI
MGGGGASIVGVPTSIAAFVGHCGSGPLDSAGKVSSWSHYEALYGGLDGGELGYAVRGFYLNGGGDAWIVRTATADAPALIGEQEPRTGLHALEQVDLFNLLCLPGLRRLDGGAWLDAATAAAACCGGRRAFLILDLPAAVATIKQAEAWARTVAPALGSANTANAAAYWPEPLMPDPLAGNAPRAVAPSGIMAGLYARTDARRGVWTAPAGIEVAMSDVLDLTVRVTDSENGVLNPLGLNVIRSFPVYGNVPWGARTLQGAEPLASDWKYVPVRRLALFIEESLCSGFQWTVFEPNAEPLWSAIRLAANAFMTDLFRNGALMGATAKDSFFVQCDAATTTWTDIDSGIVNLVVGFAPVRPAEFVVLGLQLQAAAPD